MSTITAEITEKAPQGLYLVEPHGSLIANGKKTLIAKSKLLPLEGTWLLVSKENNQGLEYGKITVGEPKMVPIDKFDSLFKYHRVTPKERSRWWPTKIELYLYPITSLELHDKPKPVNIPAGTQTIMEKIEYTTESTPESTPKPKKPKPIKDPGQDRERPYSEVGAPRESDVHSDPAEKEQKENERDHTREEVTMPWTVANPPSCAKNWTPAEKAKCVQAANAALKGGAEEQDAIFACIHAAGKTKHPGGVGKKESDLKADFITLQELLKEYGLDEIAVKAIKARGEGQGAGGPKQGDAGAETCVCPKCGHELEHERGTPCNELKCPECGTPMEGKSAKEPKEPEPKPKESDRKEIDSGMLYQPSEKAEKTEKAEKGGRRLQTEKLGLLSSLKEKFESLLKDLGELIGWASYDDRQAQSPAVLGALFKESSGLTAQKALDGRTWLLTWTTNAFQDREGEIFTTRSIEDYVARHSAESTKGKFDFWHLPGTEFGTIMWQGIEGRFLIESGPFDDTVIGRKAEEFFLAHPDGHPEIAPEGWGTSHRYKYVEGDREDGVYDWFEKTLTTVLPFSAAANQHNPQQLEVMTVDKKQYEALAGIWGPDTAAQIVELGQSQTKAKEQEVAFKSVEGTEKETTEKEQGAEPKPQAELKAEPQDGKELVQVVAEELQLGELSTAFKAFGETVATLITATKALDDRVRTLEQDDVTKLAQKEAQLPRYSWFKASTAAETALKEGDALKSTQAHKAPSVIKNIAGQVN